MRAGIIRTVADAVHVDGSRGKAQVDAIASFVDEVAKLGPEAGPLRGEAFRFGHAGVRDALVGAIDEGVEVRLLADASEAVPGLAPVASRGGVVASYGSAAGEQAQRGAGTCMHAKLWARGDEALLPTSSAAIGGEHQLNIAFRFSGPAARAAGDATEAAISGDRTRQLETLAAARDQGILINEPGVGVRHLDDAMANAIDNAERDLSLVVKEFTVPAWAERLAQAKARGVDVRVLTREMSPEVRAVLERADITERTVPFSNTPVLREVLGQRLHFNSVLADLPAPGSGAAAADAQRGVAIVGTRYLWDPVKPGDRPAREIGIALSGQNALDAQHAVEGHVGLNHLQVLRAAITGR